MRNILPNSILPTCYKLKVGIESDNVAMLELNFPDIEDSILNNDEIVIKPVARFACWMIYIDLEEPLTFISFKSCNFTIANTISNLLDTEQSLRKSQY